MITFFLSANSDEQSDHGDVQIESAPSEKLPQHRQRIHKNSREALQPVENFGHRKVQHHRRVAERYTSIKIDRSEHFQCSCKFWSFRYFIRSFLTLLLFQISDSGMNELLSGECRYTLRELIVCCSRSYGNNLENDFPNLTIFVNKRPVDEEPCNYIGPLFYYKRLIFSK